MPRPPIQLVRDRGTWLIYGQLSVWAYFVYGFTPVTPLLRAEQHTSRMVASLHGTAFALGGVLGGALIPLLIRRFDRQTRIWAGMAGAGVAVIGFTMARPMPATLACTAFAAFCGSIAVNTITATLASNHGKAGPAAISEANAAAAGVGIIAPLLVGAAVSLGWGWRPGVAVMLVGLVALMIISGVLRVRIPEGPAVAAHQTPGRLPWRFWLVFVSIVATGSVELGTNQWVSDVLVTQVGLARGTATASVAVIIGGMFVGRLVGGRLALRYPSAPVLLGGLAIAAVGFAIFWCATVVWVALAGLALLGLGGAVHFPLGMALAIEHSGGQPDLATARTAYAIGIAFGAAPFALGAIADHVGTHTAFLLVPVFLAISASVVVPLARYSGPTEALAVAPEISDLQVERVQQLPQQRQRKPDDRAGVAFDPGYKWSTEAVDGEGAGDQQRLASGDVRGDFLVRD